MAIKGVDTKCYILALFVRDDGERFLLGSGHYEFKDTQMHFAANAIQNDIVEVQGNDGFLLAGQVRRPGTQMFDGYVCNGTNSKEEVEVERRAFLQFFRRSHFYKVIYVFPNGTAIQRKQGFLVDDPTVQELYQQYPEYHVALSFEDVNYYTYEEDDQGHEIYAKEAIVPLAGGGATGGLIWDEYGVVWEDPWSLPLSISGVQFQILNNAGARAPIDNAEFYGDTYQQSYSGKNLIDSTNLSFVYANSPTQIELSSISNGIRMVNNGGASQDRFAVFRSVDLTPYVGKVVRMKATFGTGGGIRLYRIASDGSGRSQQATTTTSDNEISFTVPTGLGTSNYLGYVLDVTTGGGTTVDFTNLNLTVDNALEPFEPYTGGIPAPNPDYPQPIQVVTGEQTVTVTGKNLLDSLHGFADKYINDSGAESSGGGNNALFGYIAVKPEIAYTLSQKSDSFRLRNYGFAYYDANKTFLSRATYNLQTTQTITTPSNCSFIRIWVANSQTGVSQDIIEQSQLQFEQGSATYYEPYQGATYTVDLGATELCKIGDYQDYIYKSGDDWYVHKALSKYVFNGNETINYQSAYGGFTISSGNLISYMPGIQTPLNGYSNYFTVETSTTTWTGEGKIGLSASGTFWAKSTAFGSTQQSCETWLSTNTPTVYYVLATATDTKITDATLVGQLEALGAMKLFVGENNLSVEATGTNLPAPLSFKYYTTVAMTGAVWEEGGSGGATVVEVDSITNTYPIWRVKGPALNPQLSVINTNTTIRYTGTVTSTQTLEIDMFNKTAKLNGVSVIGNVSGDWVSLAPGTNRVIYTAENADAQPSTIEWQEVVG